MSQIIDKPKKQRRKRCKICKKKTTFADTVNLCKCKKLLCASCRSCHPCSFDYKSLKIELPPTDPTHNKLPNRL